jgi:hypothetical protein
LSSASAAAAAKMSTVSLAPAAMQPVCTRNNQGEVCTGWQLGHCQLRIWSALGGVLESKKNSPSGRQPLAKPSHPGSKSMPGPAAPPVKVARRHVMTATVNAKPPNPLQTKKTEAKAAPPVKAARRRVMTASVRSLPPGREGSSPSKSRTCGGQSSGRITHMHVAHTV